MHLLLPNTADSQVLLGGRISLLVEHLLDEVRSTVLVQVTLSAKDARTGLLILLIVTFWLEQFALVVDLADGLVLSEVLVKVLNHLLISAESLLLLIVSSVSLLFTLSVRNLLVGRLDSLPTGIARASGEIRFFGHFNVSNWFSGLLMTHEVGLSLLHLLPVVETGLGLVRGLLLLIEVVRIVPVALLLRLADLGPVGSRHLPDVGVSPEELSFGQLRLDFLLLESCHNTTG